MAWSRFEQIGIGWGKSEQVSKNLVDRSEQVSVLKQIRLRRNSSKRELEHVEVG